MCCEPFGCGLEPCPPGDFSRKIDFIPFGMPRAAVKLVNFREKLLHKFADLLIADGVFRPGISDKQGPVRNSWHRCSIWDQIWIMLMCNFRRKVIRQN